jgi:transcriptional regulator with XRE-family HTH domain
MTEEAGMAAESGLSLESLTGRNIRSVRLARRHTLDDLAELTQLTKGQLSKIENGRVSAPLSTLSRIAEALEIDPALLLRPVAGSACHVLSHAAQNERLDALKAGSLHYERLFRTSSFESTFEPMHGRLKSIRDLQTYSYPGAVLIQITHGVVVYQYGKEEHQLGPLDMLYCDGRVDHGPVRIVEGPVDFLLIFGEPRT